MISDTNDTVTLTQYKDWNDESKEKDENGGTKITFMQSAKAMAYTGPLNILLVFAPFAIISWAAAWSDAATFVFALLALAPLAERLGYVTEQLALHTNESIGGLLNATFGNATELIVAITALNRGLYRLVQLSLLGSILSNMLLVLGTAFFVGGWRHKTQTFGTISSQVNSTLLMLSTMAILFPTILSQSSTESNLAKIGYSRATSLILFLLYLLFLYFQLVSHKFLYEDEDEPQVLEETGKKSEAMENGISLHEPNGAKIFARSASNGEENQRHPHPTPLTHTKSIHDEDEEEEDELGFFNALFWLGAMTVLIAVLSEALSATIQDAADSANISAVFISAIIIPIVGNAAEHAGAVMFAWKNKVDLSLGVAMGSSTQIAVCVLPLLVIIGWMADKDLDLDFGSYEAATIFLSVVSVTFAIKDGKSNWLVGAALVAAYFIIAAGFWAHDNEDLDS